MHLTSCPSATCRDAYKFNVERNVLNGALWMCVAVPNQVLLFQWFEPRAMFMLVKSVRVEQLPRAGLSPFKLVFGVGAAHADYPQVCIGIYDRHAAVAIDDEQAETDDDSTTQHDTTQHALHLEYRLVDFNENQTLADFVANSFHTELYDTIRPWNGTARRKTAFVDRAKREVVAFQQLDRETFFIAFEHQVRRALLTKHSVLYLVDCYH